jgi:DNA-binding response OmpR family regulator
MGIDPGGGQRYGRATALSRLVDVDPDVLIVDVYLPSKNGFELARFIKAQPEWKHVGIILRLESRTSSMSKTQKRRGSAVIRKPIEASGLLAAVQPLLEQAELIECWSCYNRKS